MTSLFAKTLPTVIGDVFVATLGGLIGGSGATQDILITPTSISLPSVGSTATLAPVAVDGSGVPTGERVYLYSTDTAHVTVDPDTYVVTRVALGGSAVIYGKLVAPIVVADALAEPILGSLVGGEDVLSTTLSEYAGTTIHDMAHAYGGYSGTYGPPMAAEQFDNGPMRFFPNRDDDYCQLVPRPDGTGTAFLMRSTPGGGVSDTYGNFYLTPGNAYASYGGLGPVPNQMARQFIQFHWKYDTTEAMPLSGGYRDKGIELWHPGAQGTRVQYCTTDDGPPIFTRYIVAEGANFHPHTASHPSNNLSGSQDRAPYWGIDIANSGHGWRYTTETLPLSVSPGTVDIHLNSGDYYWAADYAVTTPAFVNGARIKIPGSDAEFVLSNVAATQSWGGETLTFATITRSATLTGNIGTFSIRGNGNFNVTQKAVFSVSRAGVLTSGDDGGWVTLAANSPRYFFQVSNFNGTNACDLYNPNVDSNSAGLTGDIIGTQYNDTQDSVHRLWIAPEGAPLGTGVLVVDQSQTGLAAGRCSRGDMASMAINWGVYHWILLGATTLGGARSAVFYGTDSVPIRWTVTGGRGL